MRRALRLVIDGKAEIVEADPERVVRSERLTLPRPAVIRLTKFIHVPRRFRRQVTNTFLFARDHYRCQYCGRHADRAQAARVADARPPHSAVARRHERLDERRDGVQPVQHAEGATACRARSGCIRCTRPVEPHFVHLSWAVRRLTPTQAQYIRTVLRRGDAPPSRGSRASSPHSGRPIVEHHKSAHSR